MMVTFVTFPAVNCQVKITFIENADLTFVLIVTIFNISDTIGRYLGGIESLMLDKDGKSFHIFCFARTLFIFSSTGIYLAYGVDSTKVFICTDILILINTILFGLSNGYVSTMCYVFAPCSVDSTIPESKQ